MTSPSQLKPSNALVDGLEFRQAHIPSPELNRYFYTAVGGDWYWIDRLSWTYGQWYDYVNRPELETWVAYLHGTPVGYFELEKQEEGNIEIIYFGLLPQFIGKGIGGQMLTKAIARAWEAGAKRVWVNTCTLDGPTALPAYQARGLALYKQEVDERELPDNPPGPWPGAKRF